MPPIMDGTKVRELRRLRGWSVASAAQKAGIGEATWKRIEANKPPRREKVWLGVCRALGVEPDAIRVGGRSRASSAPELPAAPDRRWNGDQVQINAKISVQSKNVLAACAHRYGLPQTAIVEAAPLMFFILAEQSLRERREKVAEMRRLLDQQEALAQTAGLKHLYSNVSPTDSVLFALDAEEKSIDKRDLFGAGLDALREAGDLHWDCDEEEQGWLNPFAKFLDRAANDVATFVAFTREGACFPLLDLFTEMLGPSKAAGLAAEGSAPFHAMPKSLLAAGKQEDAAAWLLANCDPDRLKMETEIDAALDAMCSEGDKP